MRIGFLIPMLHGHGGAEKFVARLSTALSARHEVVVFGLNSKEPIHNYGGKVISLGVPLGGGGGWPRKIVTLLLGLHRLARQKKKMKFDAFVSFLEIANLLNVLSFDTECRTILSIRNNPREELKDSFGKLCRILPMIFYRRASSIVFTTHSSKLIYDGMFPHHAALTTYCYNFYNASDVPLLKSKRNSEPFILGIGRLTATKGMQDLILCFSLIMDTIPHSLVIAGNGPEEAELKLLAEKLGCAVRTKFIGFAERPFELMNAAAAVILLSQYEGFPNVIAESLMCGTPIVVSDCQTGPREILGLDPSEPFNYPLFTESGCLVPVPPKVAAIPDLVHSREHDIIAKAIVRTISSISSDGQRNEIRKVFDAKFDVSALIFRWEAILAGGKN